MSKPIDWELVDYCINRYVEEVNLGVDGTRARMLSGLIYILCYYGIDDTDLGADRLNKITEKKDMVNDDVDKE